MKLLLIFASYFLGSVPIGLLLAKGIAGVDPRERGSGNIGATNVLRTTGKALGVLTLLGDMAKGFLPVMLARAWGGPLWVVAGCGFASFLGHLFPIYLRFRGGKGVATAMGVYLALSPLALLPAAALFVLAVALSRMVSVGSLLGAGGMPAFLALFGYPPQLIALSGVIGALIFLKHKDNIRRIIRGEERRLGERS